MIYTIFKEDVRANSENKLCSDNPYVSGSLEYVNWSKGWWAWVVWANKEYEW